MRVLLGIPIGWSETRTLQEGSVYEMVGHARGEGLDVKGPFIAGGCILAKNRNVILAEAERLGCDACLQLDSDMLPPSDLITRLAALDAPVCSGLAFHGAYPFTPSVFEWIPEGDRPEGFAGDDPRWWPWVPFRSIAEIPDAPFEAAGVGGSCLWIGREVWRQMAPRPFQMVYTESQFLSEDVFFCARWWQASGRGVMVDPAAELGHLRHIGINRATWEGHRGVPLEGAAV